MGLIQRQSLKYSLINWAGIFIGALSTVYVFPYALEEYGLMRFVLDTALLLFPLVSLGANSVLIRFFPYFEDKEKGHHGFLGFMLSWTVAGFLLLLLLGYLFKDWIWEPYSHKSPLFERYLWLIIPALFLTSVNNVFYRYSINYNRIVIPSFLSEVLQKLALPLLVLLYLGQWISLDGMMYGLMAYLVLVSVGFVAYIVHLKAWHLRPDLGFVTPEQWKGIRAYAVHGVVAGFTILLITKLDTILVSTLLNLKKGGIYSISSFIANVIEVPARAVIGIGIPLLSRYWKENNRAEIESLYKKTSINLLMMGLLLFGSFWVSVDFFFDIIANGEEMRQGKYIILILAAARLVDMSTGINNHILIYSDKINYAYGQLILPALLSLSLGIYLTQTYGMLGTAIANLVAVIAYNGISLLFNWHLFGMQPFGKNALVVLVLALVVYMGVVWVPVPAGYPFWAIALRSSLFLGVLGLAYYKAGVSPDFNGAVKKALARFV